jgi:hypothetical protein
VDRPVHPATSHQGRVGRVDNGTAFFLGDVAGFDENGHKYLLERRGFSENYSDNGFLEWEEREVIGH